ncbi:MAG: DUF2807 domain-containing protein [Chitinophagaceae bacterium]|nr:DUF2807 domain-containing protein [Chitinophagaceae bacterium]
MKKAILFLTVLLALTSFAQEKIISDPNAEQRAVGSFHAIKVSEGIDLILKQGNTEAVAVSASEKQYRDRIKTEVVGGVLKISFDFNLFKDLKYRNKNLKAYVSFKKLDKIVGSSGAETRIDGTLTADDLVINLSSGAGLTGEIEATSLDIDESSGATSSISGRVEILKVEATTGAHFVGNDLVANKCDANASTGGKIQIRVESELTADASTGGEILYKGHGSITTASTRLGGEIRKR